MVDTVKQTVITLKKFDMNLHEKINLRSNFPHFKFRARLPYQDRFIKAHINECHLNQPHFENS